MPAWKKRPDKMTELIANGWHSEQWNPREHSTAFVSKVDEEAARRVIFSDKWHAPFPRGSNPFYIRDDSSSKLGLERIISAVRKVGRPLGISVNKNRDYIELTISERDYERNIHPQIPTVKR